jgi:cell division protein ZapA (FtsZ GTPase activity inhibitor)
MSKSNFKVTMESTKNSTVAIGPKARAATTVLGSQADPESLRRVLAETDQLIELLTAHQNEMANSEALLATAVNVKDKLAKKHPKLKPIRAALEHIAEGVAGVGVLADCVARIQALITHLAF